MQDYRLFMFSAAGCLLLSFTMNIATVASEEEIKQKDEIITKLQTEPLTTSLEKETSDVIRKFKSKKLYAEACEIKEILKNSRINAQINTVETNINDLNAKLHETQSPSDQNTIVKQITKLEKQITNLKRELRPSSVILKQCQKQTE